MEGAYEKSKSLCCAKAKAKAGPGEGLGVGEVFQGVVLGTELAGSRESQEQVLEGKRQVGAPAGG